MRSTGVEPAPRTPRATSLPLTVLLRLGGLPVIAGLGLLATGSPAQLSWAVLLAVAAGPAVLASGHRVVGPLARFAEVVLVGLGASAVAAAANDAGIVPAGFAAGALLPYLAVPVADAALQHRSGEAFALLLVAAGTLTAAGAATTVAGAPLLARPGYIVACVQWLLVAAFGTIVIHGLQQMLLSRLSPQPYAEATRLLTQLRSVARKLPGATLDPGGIAETLLGEVRQAAPAERAAVLTASGGGRLVVVAQAGAGRVDWETALDADSAVADAWASQQPQTAARSQARTHPGGDVSALVLPLVAGVRTIGLLAIETDTPGAYPPQLVERVRVIAAPSALRLEAALLFDEVRSLATNEERQRLAREIHDGVAQELVMVGYGIDNALASLPAGGAEAAGELKTLRGEVTRVITELRMSLFELRSEVDRHGGLAAAIAEYARTVGASAGLRVHLSLDESTARLPTAIEAELLRIAQEAITNARKHAGATNLWVTCAVDPPTAQIVVSDDGQGMANRGEDGRYGLAIMAERAERIRGRLEIRPRQPHGTTVAVMLGRDPTR